ncbi:MAG: hypothetical protein HRU19_02300 [Pseudobacteriovorax sp.]|nr:hypothetical protein [Pseudobacteriovorax sp.]
MLSKVLAVGGLLAVAQTGFAADFSVQINTNVFNYGSTTQEVDANGTTTETTTTGYVTHPGDLEAIIGYGKHVFYLYPVQATSFGYGFMVTDTLEVGATIELDSVKQEKGTEETTSTATNIGPYIYYYGSLTNASYEAFFSLSLTNETQEFTNSADATANRETDSQRTGFNLGVKYIKPLVNGFSYWAGLTFTSATGTNTVTTAVTEEEGDVTISGFAITLFGLRLDF